MYSTTAYKLQKMMQQIEVPSFYLQSDKAVKKSVLDMPTEQLGAMGAKVCAMASLVWDYSDTVMDISKGLGIAATKPLARALRQLRRDYDSWRQYHGVDSYTYAAEVKKGLFIEELCREQFGILARSLEREVVDNDPELLPEWVLLVCAVQTALTALDALVVYAGRCDAEIRASVGGQPHSILRDELRAIRPILEQYAGDHYKGVPQIRRQVSLALADELTNLQTVQ